MNNCSEKVLIRILSVDEFKNYLTDSTLNDNVVKCSTDVWNNYDKDNRIIKIRSSVMTGGSNVFPEIIQNNINQKHEYMNGLTNYEDSDDIKMRWVEDNIYNTQHITYTKIDKTTATAIETTPTYSPSFRPVFNYIDNTKSTNLFY
jgi:hypothetical protein